MLTTQDNERWRAVEARHDESFIYAVLSTRIYCRPSCPSRLPRRENVRFFDSSTAAEDAGFRPCKRCHPHEGGLRKRQQATVTRACRIIESTPDPVDLPSLAETTGSSPSHLHRLFRELLGCTPKQYADAHRATRIRNTLHSAPSVTEAFYEAGFNSSSRFYTTSEAMLGMQPKRLRAGGAGEDIRFALAECRLGTILIAASKKGICWISLGENPEDLLDEFQRRFSRATLMGGEPEFESLIAAALAAIERQLPSNELPLDIRGSAFQLKVWHALRAIPSGKTVSYTTLAEGIGQPSAVRAVASACAQNPIAVLIPCHRVVRIDGSLSGYRWGVERKAKLLEAERELQPRSIVT